MSSIVGVVAGFMLASDVGCAKEPMHAVGEGAARAEPLAVRAELREQVAMPYACEMRGGKPLLTSTTEQSYTLLGGRAEQPFTVCAPTDGKRCRTIMVHRFSMLCGATRVAWMDVVANTPAPGFGRAYVDGSRFYMQPGRRFGPLFDGACEEATGIERARCYAQPVPRRGGALIAFPPGFAPLAEIGARIVLPGPALTTSAGAAAWPLLATATGGSTAPNKADAPKPEVSKAEASGGDTSRVEAPRVEAPLVAIPLPVETARAAEAPFVTTIEPAAAQRTQVPTTSPSAVTARRMEVATTAQPSSLPGWVTIVEPVMAATAMPAASSPFAYLERLAIMIILGLAALSGLFWLTLGEAPWQYFGRSRSRAVSVRLANLQTFAGLGIPDVELCRDLSQTAVGLIDQVHTAIDSLAVAPPLKRVLARETRIVEQRLASLLSTEPKNDEAWRRLRVRVTQVVVDLTRLRDIGDGALKSLAGARKNADGPKDRAEAYEVLGVNADINERILKKLVEALRACWHPDLAKNDADRIEREHRIKQINVACDLINGKRQEAA